MWQLLREYKGVWQLNLARTLLRCVTSINPINPVDWSKPRSDGGSPLTGYAIERRDAASNYWTALSTTARRASSWRTCGMGTVAPLDFDMCFQLFSLTFKIFNNRKITLWIRYFFIDFLRSLQCVRYFRCSLNPTKTVSYFHSIQYLTFARLFLTFLCFVISSCMFIVHFVLSTFSYF